MFQFFFSFEKTIKSHEFWTCFRKKTKRFTNSKIRKKSEKIRMYLSKLTTQFWLTKSYITGFFVEDFIFTNLLLTFRIYYYVKSIFSARPE